VKNLSVVLAAKAAMAKSLYCYYCQGKRRSKKEGAARKEKNHTGRS
jgi:hypothetical protein